jgi:hypothetical protein
MKRSIVVMMVALLGAACSSSGNGDGGTTSGTTSGTTNGTGTTGTGTGTGTTGTSTAGTTGGSTGNITVTINSLDLLPPASDWLTNNGLPVPSIYDGGYEMILSGLRLDIINQTVILTTLATLPLTPSSPPPPYTFIVNVPDAGSSVGAGLLAAVALVGADMLGDAGLVEPQLSCGQIAQAIDAGAAALGGAYFDYFLPAGSAIGPVLSPPTMDVSGTVYAIPVSFAAQLSCAAGIPTDDGGILGTGISLFYFTQNAAGLGSPIAGATVNNMGNGQCYYYASDFTTGSTTPPTDATGLAAITAVTPGGNGLPPSMTSTIPGMSAQLPGQRVQSNKGNVQEIFPVQ